MEFTAIEKKINNLCRIILIIIPVYYLFLFVRSGILDNTKIQELSVLFFLMVFEGLPFILIGSVVAAIINLFFSEDLILKIVSRNNYVNIIAASFAGMFFPLCECGIVPVIKKLLDKKMPLHMAVTIMVSVPIVNPIVILTTYLAFPGRVDIILIRLFSGIIISVTAGILVYYKYSRKEKNSYLINACISPEKNCSCHLSHQQKERIITHDIFICIDHVIKEFFHMGRYYIAGSFLAAFFRTCLPKTVIYTFADNNLLSILFMMILAFVLSVCSESDAFIARKFLGIFPDSSIIGFLVFGPMCDLKNTIMLLGVFKKGFVVFLISAVFTLCFLNSIIISMIAGQG